MTNDEGTSLERFLAEGSTMKFEELGVETQLNVIWSETLWSDLLATTRLGESDLFDWVAAHGAVHQHVADRADLPEAIAVRFASLFTGEALEALAYRSSEMPLLQRAVAATGSEEARQVLARKRILDAEAALTIARTSASSYTLGILARRGPQLGMDPELFAALSLRQGVKAWTDLTFCTQPLDHWGVVGYQYALYAEKEQTEEYVEAQGADLLEVRALGEKWVGTLDGLIEAWRLTKR